MAEDIHPHWSQALSLKMPISLIMPILWIDDHWPHRYENYYSDRCNSKITEVEAIQIIGWINLSLISEVFTCSVSWDLHQLYTDWNSFKTLDVRFVPWYFHTPIRQYKCQFLPHVITKRGSRRFDCDVRLWDQLSQILLCYYCCSGLSSRTDEIAL